MTKRAVIDLPEHIRERLEIGPVEGCWLSTNSPNRNGYTYMTSKGVQETLAHRTVYVLLKGAIPQNMTLDHLCRVPRCVNPLHMEVVTRQENSRRMARARHKHIDDKWKALDGKTFYV